jgi:hypothetical protein
MKKMPWDLGKVDQSLSPKIQAPSGTGFILSCMAKSQVHVEEDIPEQYKAFSQCNWRLTSTLLTSLLG